MQSAIIFLGTGTGALVRGKQLRNTGGIALILENNQFILDPGPGCLLKAKEYGINLRQTTAVLVSHNHLNHANDINAVIDAMSYGGMDRQGILIGSKSIVDGPGFLQPPYKLFVEKVISLQQGQRAAVNTVEFQALPTVHQD